jgi:5-methylcytosine-specific restriction endonuclease McrA
MLGPHLTDANHLEVLALAKHRTKREIAGLVRRIDPLPDVPARIEPLGPVARGNPLRSGTYAQFVEALTGPVRELGPGDRPSDWLEDGGEGDGAASAELVPEPDRALATTEQPPGEEPENERRDEFSARELMLAPQRYKVQFTASQEYVDLLEQAKDLLTPAVSRRDLEQVHLRALRLLVAELKKRKYAVTDRPRPPRRKGRSAPARIEAARIEAKQQASEGNQPQPGPPKAAPAPPETAHAVSPRQRGKSRKRAAEQANAGPRAARAAGEPGTRTIPAAVRRTVAERDQYRCTYVDDRGHRCRETGGLELHHEHAYALGGPATESNIALRCRAHNALAAEQDYGREFMASKLARAPAPARSF